MLLNLIQHNYFLLIDWLVCRFWDRVLLYSSSWPWTHYADEAGLDPKTGGPPAFASRAGIVDMHHHTCHEYWLKKALAFCVCAPAYTHAHTHVYTHYTCMYILIQHIFPQRNFYLCSANKWVILFNICAISSFWMCGKNVMNHASFLFMLGNGLLTSEAEWFETKWQAYSFVSSTILSS